MHGPTESVLGYWVAYGRVPERKTFFWSGEWWVRFKDSSWSEATKGYVCGLPDDTPVFVESIEGLKPCTNTPKQSWLNLPTRS